MTFAGASSAGSPCHATPAKEPRGHERQPHARGDIPHTRAAHLNCELGFEALGCEALASLPPPPTPEEEEEEVANAHCPLITS